MAKKLNFSLGLSTNKNIGGNDTWVKQELAECKFRDECLGKRFQKLFKCLWNGVGKSIPFACQDWAGTKVAYRFFSNDRVREEEILSGHFQSTKDRFLKQLEIFWFCMIRQNFPISVRIQSRLD